MCFVLFLLFENGNFASLQRFDLRFYCFKSDSLFVFEGFDKVECDFFLTFDCLYDEIFLSWIELLKICNNFFFHLLWKERRNLKTLENILRIHFFDSNRSIPALLYHTFLETANNFLPKYLFLPSKHLTFLFFHYNSRAFFKFIGV